MDWSSWLNWDLNKILFWSLIGLMVWLISQTNDLKTKIKSPLLVGFASSMIGAFEIGIASIVSGALYFLFLYILRYWFFKFNKKNIKDSGREKIESENEGK